MTIIGPLDIGESRNKLQALVQDPRVRLELEWAGDSEMAKKAIAHPECAVVLNGRSLYHWQELKSVLAGEGEGVQVPVTRLEGWLADALAGVPGNDDEIPVKVNETDQPLFLKGLSGRQPVTKQDFRRQTSRLLKQSGLGNDSLMDRILTRHISRLMTRVFLEFPITPNQITLISLLVGLIGALCFVQGGYEWGVAGAALVQVSAWIDCTDGEVARLRFQDSPLGSVLDIWADNLVHITVFFSIGLGLYFSTEQGIYKILGSLAACGAMGSFALLQGSVVQGKELAASGQANAEGASVTDRLANRDFTYFLLITAVLDYLGLFLVLTAVGSNIFAASLLYSRYRSRERGHVNSLETGSH